MTLEKTEIILPTVVEIGTSSKYLVLRLCLYGVAGFAAACWIGVHYHDKGIIIGALVGIPVLMALFLALVQEPTISWSRRNVRILLWVAIFLQLALGIWHLMDRN